MATPITTRRLFRFAGGSEVVVEVRSSLMRLRGDLVRDTMEGFLPLRRLRTMSYLDPVRPPAISGHVRRVERKRRVVWYAKYRAPDPTAPGGVRQVNKLLGPEWPDGGPPPPGYFDRRTAQAALEAILTDARRGHMEVVRTGVSFEQLSQEWLAWGEHERGWRRSATAVPAFACTCSRRSDACASSRSPRRASSAG